ncbi:MAG: M28 family peptidase [Gammaproteobacteria bacterium]|nr:M28 family peptidase [Gammaproteobacteria bacterium]
MLNAICRTAIVAVLIVVLASCGRAPMHSTAKTAESALDLITARAIEGHVSVLADDALTGREAGTEGYDKSAEYVAEQFAAMGLLAGGSDAWYQPVTLTEYRLDTDSATMVLHRDGKDTALAYRDDFGMGADAVRDSTSVRAEVVYVGYGVHAPELGYSDYDVVDVRGKVVAGFSGAPSSIEGSERAYYASSRTKRAEAVARGAVGLISLRSRKAEQRRPWDEAKKRFGRRSGKTWVSDDGRSAGYFPEIQGNAYTSMLVGEKLFGLSPLSYEQALDFAEANTPASAPLDVEVTLEQRSTHASVSSPNVIGMIRGTDPTLADEYVVYSAHLDHIGVAGDEEDNIYNGAYDNAMGVALMLETARALNAAPPRRSVLFIALTAEESGLLGSDFFVNNPTVPIDSIVANINLDMPLFLYPVADLVAFGSQHSSLHSAVEEAAAAEGFVFSPDPLPEENLFVRSDQYSFVRKGVPAVYLIPGFTSSNDDIDGEALFRDHIENHYHEPSDDLTRPVDWDSALRFARAHTRLGYIVANLGERPTWNEGDFFASRFAPRK